MAMQSGGNTFYLAYDQVGSLISIADTAGNVIRSITYDSFGNVIQDSAPNVWIPIGFAGGLYDPDTGLIRFGFREYSPEIGRWTAKDPILFQGGMDVYGYCLSDPINSFDSLGLFYYMVTVKYSNAPYGSVTMEWNGWLPSFYQSGTVGDTGKEIESGIYKYQYGQHPMNPANNVHPPYPALNLYTLGGDRTLPATLNGKKTTASGVNFHRGNSKRTAKKTGEIGSTACHVIPYENWDDFISNFDEGDKGLYFYFRLW
jgi:RHS repeat-associated protein